MKTTASPSFSVARPSYGVVGMIALLFLAAVLPAAEPVKDLASRQVRPSPEWLTRGVMYQIWLRSFTPEGTLAAATKRLPSIAELGANIVYLSPISLQDADMRQEHWSKRQKASGTNNPRNPYRIADYNRVDPEFGSDADLRAFIATAHRHGLRVLLDLVYYHCGPTSVLLEHPEYFKRDAAGNISTGEWNFPVLNFENRELREYLWANMRHWVKDFDVDGFRCDVADQVPLDFWEEARRRLEPIRPDLVILAEGNRRPADQLTAFDVDYGFSWYLAMEAVLTRGAAASALRANWEATAAAWPRGSRFTRYTENHDTVNDMRQADPTFSKAGTAAMTVINFAIDGVPFLYNGQEIGDTSVQSIYARWPIRWEAACLPSAKKTFEFHQRLCQLRRSEAALYGGEVVWLDNDRPDAVVSFLRRSGNDKILCVVNLSNRIVKAKLTMPNGVATSFEPLLGNAGKSPTGAEEFALAGFGYYLGKNR